MYSPPSHGRALIASAGLACFVTAASYTALAISLNPLGVLFAGVFGVPFGVVGALAILAPFLIAAHKILGPDALLPAGATAGLAHTLLGALLIQGFGDTPDFALMVCTGTILAAWASTDPLGLPLLAACAAIAGGLAGLHYERRIARAS